MSDRSPTYQRISCVESTGYVGMINERYQVGVRSAFEIAEAFTQVNVDSHRRSAVGHGARCLAYACKFDVEHLSATRRATVWFKVTYKTRLILNMRLEKLD